MKAPLDGIRVIELTRTGPGTFCTKMLGDMGAEVIKIEEPFRKAPGGMGQEKWRRVAFDRKKKSLCLNLKLDEGRKVFHKLAGDGDIVVEGFRPGVTKRLGVDYETLNNINRGIICCSLSGFGQTGPYKNSPGHDLNYIAMSGVLDLIGEKNGPPVIPQNLLGDYASAALHGVIGIMMAIIARGQSGQGQNVDISFLDGVTSLLGAVPSVAEYLSTNQIPKRGEAMLSGAYPYYGLYKTKDGEYLALGCIEHHFWQNLCKALDLEEFASYAFESRHYSNPPEDKWIKVQDILDKMFLTKNHDYWLELFEKHDVPVTKVLNIEEALNNPQTMARGMIHEVEDPEVGRVKQIGFPIKLSRTPEFVPGIPPYPGQHSNDILKNLGYNTDEINDLIQKKITAV